MRFVQVTIIAATCFVADAVAAQDTKAKDSMAQTLAFDADARRLKDSCPDVDELNRIGATKPEPWAGRYKSEASSRQKAALQHLQSELVMLADRAKSFDSDFFANGDRPDGSRDDIEGAPTPASLVGDLRSVVQRMSCYDAEKAKSILATVDSLDVTLKKKVAEETACRASPKCMGDRLQAVACELLENRRGAMAEIKQEKSNPAGVVNLARLHELGESVQAIDASLADTKAKYLKATHKAFSPALCKASAQ